MATICLTFAASHSPAHDAPQERGTEKPAPAHYLNTQTGVEYVGDQVCGSCHSGEYKSFKQTAMGRSASIPSQDDLQSLAKPITFSSSTLDRTYSVYTHNGKMYHEESQRDPKGQLVFSETHEIAYVVGTGEVGKSYLVSKGDAFFVSPISFYTRINGWDLSPGYETSLFRGFTRPVLELCVDCHTGQPLFVPDRPDHFQQPPFRFLSIGCERCHGPGAIHVMQRKEGAPLEGSIDLPSLTPRTCPRKSVTMSARNATSSATPGSCGRGKTISTSGPEHRWIEWWPFFLFLQRSRRNRSFALDQFEQLKLSRCAIASKGTPGLHHLP